VLTEDVRFLEEAERAQVLGAQRRVVAAFGEAIAVVRPTLARNELEKPLAMLLFGMINWMFTWLRPEGALTHEAMAPVVADLFFGGINAVRIPSGAAEPVAHAAHPAD
jgi:TetR/AcrR family transcriptional regulator